jgi:hypothetical protein
VKVKSLILLAALVLAGCQSSRTERVGNFIITHGKPSAAELGHDGTVMGLLELGAFEFTASHEPLSHPDSKAIMAKNRIPLKIQKLNGQQISIVGKYLPLKIDSKRDLLLEGLLLPLGVHHCSLHNPDINEWV